MDGSISSYKIVLLSRRVHVIQRLSRFYCQHFEILPYFFLDIISGMGNFIILDRLARRKGMLRSIPPNSSYFMRFQSTDIQASQTSLTACQQWVWREPPRRIARIV